MLKTLCQLPHLTWSRIFTFKRQILKTGILMSQARIRASCQMLPYLCYSSNSCTLDLRFQNNSLPKTGYHSSILGRNSNSDLLCSSVFSNHLLINKFSTNPATTPDEEKNLSIFKKFKLMYKRYWYVLIPVHCITSVFWYGGFFLAAKSGMDVVGLLESLGASEFMMNYLKEHSSAGYFAIAYALYKVATPARYTVTLAGTTLSINYLKKWGYLRPVPSREELQELYTMKMEELMGKREEFRERYFEAKGELKEKYQEKKEEFKGIVEERKDKLSSFRNKSFETKEQK